MTSEVVPSSSVPPSTDAGGGFRSRFARFAGSRSTTPELDPLIRTLRTYHPRSDLRMLQRAYETAAYLHRDQQRRSGDPYITHPIAVATILAELGMTVPTLAAALLHDTVEDTGYSLDALREDFGDEVGACVLNDGGGSIGGLGFFGHGGSWCYFAHIRSMILIGELIND